MSKKQGSYEDYLNSLKVDYNNFKQKVNDDNDYNFNFDNDDYFEKEIRGGGGRNTRKGYAFNDYQDLVDLVGSKKHKDIKTKQAFTSPAAFDIWQNNPKYPSRLKWSAQNIDLDNDGHNEFIVKDKYDNIIGVNGYYLANSKYPERYAYQESVRRFEDGPRKGRPEYSFDNWYNSELGGSKRFNDKSLEMNYPEDIQQKPLYKMYDKYGKVDKKLPAKIRAYKHFTSVIFPAIVQAAKEGLISGVSEIQQNKILSHKIPEIIQVVKYPGDTAVQAARFYTAQCFYAWNQHIIQPILHLERMKKAIAEEVRDVKGLMKSDQDFREITQTMTLQN